MVPRQQVIDYISSNMRSGYDIPSIRSRLIASGYEPGEINAAVDIIRSGKNNAEPKTGAHIFVVIGIVMFAFLFIAGSAFFLKTMAGQTTIDPSSSSFDKPVSTKPPVTDSSTTISPPKTSTTPKDTSTNTDSSTNSNFKGTNNVRDTIPSIDYGTGTAPSTLTTRLAIENKVNQLALSKPDEAATLCNQINTLAGKNSCLNTVAQVSEVSRFCTQISDVDLADVCLTSLAIKQVEDVNLCKQITSKLRFNQCVTIYDSQSQLATVQKAAAQVSTQSFAQNTVTDEQLAAASTVTLNDVMVLPPDTSASNNQETSPVNETTNNTTTTQPECVTEGNSIAVIPNAPSCCAGLQLINPISQDIVGSSGICTAFCGNNVCDPQIESEYNCPSDCVMQQ